MAEPPILTDRVLNPISTTSGASAKANLKALREQRRIPMYVDRTDEILQLLDALAVEAYATIRMMRVRGNALRMQAVVAKQMVLELRKRKVDLEL